MVYSSANADGVIVMLI